jgi:hypothetical protein
VLNMFLIMRLRDLCTHRHLERCFMPRSAGSTGIPLVVPVGINLADGSALALRVFVLAVVPVVYW